MDIETGVVLDYIKVLINEYEMLAQEQTENADNEALYRELNLEPLIGKSINPINLANNLRESNEWEMSYRRDALRFQEEANRLREQHERSSTMSTGMRRFPLGSLPDRPYNGRQGSRVPVTGAHDQRTVRIPAHAA